MSGRERGALWLMAAPFLIGVTLLVFGPVAWTVAISLFDYDLIGSPTFAGTANFRELFDDPIFGVAVRNSVLFLATVVPLKLVGALVLALLLYEPGRLLGVGRVAAIAPSIVPDAAYALLWLWILNPLYGPLNTTLEVLGLPSPAWFSEPVPTWWAVVAMASLQLGEGFLIALVARRHVPRDLIELASISGAGRWSTFVRVTFPVMAPFLLVVAARDVTLALQASFAPGAILTDGGPPPFATTYVPFFVYRTGFEYLRYGEAAAATVVMLSFSMSLVWLVYAAVGRRVLRSLLEG